MSQNRDNFMTGKSSTRVAAAPGGNSTFSLGWGGVSEQPKKKRNLGKPTTNVISQAPQVLKDQSNALHVKQFTEETGTKCPNQPCLMNKDEVEFVSKMILDEMLELMATHHEPTQAKKY
eukprot:UN32965